MSRTYRLIKESPKALGLGSWIMFDWKSFKDINPYSKEGKKRIAKFFRDGTPSLMRVHGPSWFHNMTSQRPHRRKSKTELKKFKQSFEIECLYDFRKHQYFAAYDYSEYSWWIDQFNPLDDVYEVMIPNKPRREYWY